MRHSAYVWEYASDTDDGTVYVDRLQHAHPCSLDTWHVHQAHDRFHAAHPALADDPRYRQLADRLEQEQARGDAEWVPPMQSSERPPPLQQLRSRSEYLGHINKGKKERFLKKVRRFLHDRKDAFDAFPLRALRAVHLAESQGLLQPDRRRARQQRRRDTEVHHWRRMYGKDAPYPGRYREGEDPAATEEGLGLLPCCRAIDDRSGPRSRSSACCAVVGAQVMPNLYAWQAYASGGAALLLGIVLTAVVASTLDTAFALPKLYYTALMLGISLILNAAVALLGTYCKSLDVVHFSGAINVLCVILGFSIAGLGAVNVYHVKTNVSAHLYPSAPSAALVDDCEHNVRVLLWVLTVATAALTAVTYLALTRAHLWLSPYARFSDNDELSRNSPEELSRRAEEDALAKARQRVGALERCMAAYSTTYPGGWE
jgi:hypothetical protein